MAAVICSCLLVLLGLGGYRLIWRRRYGPRRIEEPHLRVQGRVKRRGDAPDPVLLRTAMGELRGDSFEVEQPEGGTCRIDTRSPCLSFIGKALRAGELVTVDGVPRLMLRAEALYRQPSVRPVLEALWVARGAWPELRLLRVAFAFAGLLLLAAMGLPFAVETRPLENRTAEPYRPPAPQLSCPPGTSQRGEHPEFWCALATGGRHGPWVKQGDGGELLEAGNYREGCKHGSFVAHGWGGYRWRGEFRDGLKIGLFEQWRGPGRPALRQYYADDQADGEILIWDELRQLRERGWYRAGLKHGHFELWSAQGILMRAGPYIAGRRHGLWRFWNRDGGRAARGVFRNGKRHGLWRWWHETGHLAGRGRFADAKKQGAWRSFHPGGQLAVVGFYCDGQRCGRWQSWPEGSGQRGRKPGS